MVFQKTCCGSQHSSGMAASDAITLCLGTSRTDCNQGIAGGHSELYALPRHIPHGLQPPPRFPPFLRRFLCLGTSRTDCNTGKMGYCWNCKLCLGTSRTDCNCDPPMAIRPSRTLPRHIPHGLQPQKCTGCNTRFCGMCRESVDSFLGIEELLYADRVIFPCSSATKVICITIIGSPGRTIDRFSSANCTRFYVYLAFALMAVSMNAHAGRRFRQCGQALNCLTMVLYKLGMALHVEGNQTEIFLSKGHSVAAETPSTDLAEFVAHPAYNSNASIMIFAYICQIDGYTDWLGRMLAPSQRQEGRVIRISVVKF